MVFLIISAVELCGGADKIETSLTVKDPGRVSQDEEEGEGKWPVILCEYDDAFKGN